MKGFLPKQSLEDPRLQVNIIDVVEVCEVRVDLQDPVQLGQGYRNDIDDT